MGSFGAPPDSNVLSYPGISGNRFNPVEAGRVWAECIKGEQNSGYVHRMLDTHGKLGLPQAWAQDMTRKDGLMPSYESLDEVYYMTGWKKNKFGATRQPDIRQFIPALAKGMKNKQKRPRRKFDDELSSIADSDFDCPPRTACSQARSQRSLKTPLPKERLSCSASAPSLAPARAPPPPSTPPPATQRLMSSTAPSAFGLPSLKANGELSTARSSLRKGQKDRIASLVCSEVHSQCSDLVGKTRLRR